jgi:nucleoside-diphosphate-sugar epimerase
LEADTNIHLVLGDLGDKEAIDKAVKGIDVVYHVGAAMKGSGADFERGTVQGTRNIVDACVRFGVRRFVHVSSMSVLDHAGPRTGAVNESSRLEPYPEQRGFYTQTKLEAEKIVLDAVRAYGLPAVILRPGQIFGPGAEHVSPSGAFGLAGRWIVAGKGDLPLPLVYVDDVVDALILAGTQRNVEGLIVQLVDNEAVTQQEYINHRQQWAPQKVMYCPTWLLLLAGTAVETLGKVLGRAVPLSRYRIRSLRPLAPCDCSVARNSLGWLPGIGTRNGLRRTFLASAESKKDEPVAVSH